LVFFRYLEAEKAFHYSEKKLAEAQKMAEENKTEKIGKALKKYHEYLNQSLKEAEKAKEQGKNVDEVLAIVAEATQKHLIVLEGVYEKVPEQAKDAVSSAMNESNKGQENALSAISGEKKKEVEKEVDKIKEKYQPDKIPGDLPKDLEKSIEKRPDKETDSKEKIEKPESEKPERNDNESNNPWN